MLKQQAGRQERRQAAHTRITHCAGTSLSAGAPPQAEPSRVTPASSSSCRATLHPARGGKGREASSSSSRGASHQHRRVNANRQAGAGLGSTGHSCQHKQSRHWPHCALRPTASPCHPPELRARHVAAPLLQGRQRGIGGGQGSLAGNLQILHLSTQQAAVRQAPHALAAEPGGGGKEAGAGEGEREGEREPNRGAMSCQQGCPACCTACPSASARALQSCYRLLASQRTSPG